MKSTRLLILIALFPIVVQAQPICEEAVSTTEINQCLADELDKAETVMETYLAKSEERYSGDLGVLESLAASQAVWLIYREAHCRAVYDTQRNGTIRTAVNLSCSAELTRQRTHTVWKSFLTFEDSAPLLPEPEPYDSRSN